jgi:hypothetical protein
MMQEMMFGNGWPNSFLLRIVDISFLKIRRGTAIWQRFDPRAALWKITKEHYQDWTC